MRGFWVCALLLASVGLAQTRPDEDALFGGAPDAGQPAEQSIPTTPAPNAFDTGTVREDPLKIGGLFYQRGIVQAAHNTSPDNTRISFPTLLDTFLDARPTDRVRAMVLGRLSYDPYLQTTIPGLPAPANPPANPSVALDQAWLTFDIAHSVFITAGRQHVKWGTGRFFNPTDFLSSARRDPLAQFDTRLGVTMIRANVPWESKGWNFTGVAVLEPTQVVGNLGIGGTSGSTLPQTGTTAGATAGTGTTLGTVGGAARAEVQLGSAALGIDGMTQKNRKSRLGLDVSTPLGPLDFYAEGLIIQGSDIPLYQKNPAAPPGTSVFGLYETYQPSHITPSVVGGLNYVFPFHDNKSVTLAGEYFFNKTGYSDAHIYPWLILNGVYQPFYTGQHYLAASATYSDPAAKTSYTLSNIGNLSDQSYVARFDFSVILLSYLTVEAFADYHYGTLGGEFRFAVDTTSENAADSRVPAVVIEAPIFDVGFGFRVAI